MKYHFKIHREGKSYWAECLELQGCLTQADTRDELEVNMREALNLYLNEPEKSRANFPLPEPDAARLRNVREIPVDSKVAFSFLLRKARREKNISQPGMACLLGHNSVYSYQKLESSKTANPTLLKVQKLKEILPNLRLDLLFS